MYNPMDLKGKRILVTGASSGIGREIVNLLDKLEVHVVLVGRDETKLKDLINTLINKDHEYVVFDLNEIDKIERLYSEICKDGLKLDGLVHSAGVDKCIPLRMTTNEMLNGVMNINFFAFYELARLYSKKKNNNGGSIVAISSVAGQRGRKAYSAYCASKSAIDGAVRAMALELADIHIRINGVAPAFIETPMYEEYKEMVDETTMKKILDKQYLGIGSPIDVANAVVFLLSDAAKFITGTVMAVDGGYLSQ